MRNIGVIGSNEILFKFIFDDESKDGDEYTRWHRVDNKQDLEMDTSTGNEKSDANSLPVTPRRWEIVWNEIRKFMKFKDYKSILEISPRELDKIIKGKFTPDFKHEFIDWFEQHVGNVDIEDIIADPMNVFPSKSGRTDDAVIVSDIWEQFEKKYKKVGDCPDADLVNIFTWFGIHFKDEVNVVFNEFYNNLDKIITIHTKEGMCQILHAAWPDSEDFEVLDKKTTNKIKKIMKEKFPWRIDGDKIKYINNFEENDK